MERKVTIILSILIVLLILILGGYFIINNRRNARDSNQNLEIGEDMTNIDTSNVTIFNTIQSDTNQQSNSESEITNEETLIKQTNQSTVNKGNNEMSTLNLKIGSENFVATLYDNETTRELIKRMPLSINMSELHGNEKYYYFEEEFPTNSETIANIKTGDLMLYGSDCLVVFYKSFSNSFHYTKLGKINNPSKLANAVGNGNIQITFSINN